MAGPEERSLPNAHQSMQAESLGTVIGRLDRRVQSGSIQEFLAIQTGFTELDLAIGGGFHQGQLILLSGPTGIGKTSFAMQIARNMVSSGRAFCLFACYEHETDYLAQRLVAMESLETGYGGPGDGLRLRDISDLVRSQKESYPGDPGFLTAVRRDPRGAQALERIARYSNDLLLMKGSPYNTSVRTLADVVRRELALRSAGPERPLVLFVDYLQKIAAATPRAEQDARNIEAIDELKALALEQGIVVVAILAAQIEGLRAQRMRLENLLTSAELAYEADMIMIMNEKYDLVDRQHIDYNHYNAQVFHQYVVVSIEKNRMGSDLVDLQFRKQLQFCRFGSVAERVSEHLITGRRRE
jgi:replicative DNA helicase